MVPGVFIRCFYQKRPCRTPAWPIPMIFIIGLRRREFI